VKICAAIALCCVLVSALAVAPFFFMGQPLPGQSRWSLRMPDSHDMFLQYDQMRDFYRGLAAGEVYPRWEEDTNRGYGAPTTCFYPPGVYYITSPIHLLFSDWTVVLLVTYLAVMSASAGASYLLARRWMSREAAAVAAIAYVWFPYHAIDQYDRGALAELLCFVWMPLTLFFVDRLLSGRKSRVLPAVGLALSYGSFLWSHPPTAYQFSLTIAPFVPALAWSRRDWKGLVWACAGFALGAGLSAAYLYPAAMEQNLIRHEILDKIWPYHATYLFMYAGYSQSYYEFFQRLNVSWCLSVAAIVAAIPALWKRRGPFWFLTGVGSFAAFLMLRFSAPIGRRIPRIEIGVFSWRMLAITTLVAALLAGVIAEAALEAWRSRSRGRCAAYGAFAGVVLLAGIGFTIGGVMAPANERVAFRPPREHTNYAIIPRSAPAETDEMIAMPRALLDGADGRVSVREWKPQHRVMDVAAPASARLVVRTFNYPGWSAKVDGHAAALATDNATGAILMAIPAGEHSVTLDFLDTPVRTRGVWITLLSFVTLLACGAIALTARVL